MTGPPGETAAWSQAYARPELQARRRRTYEAKLDRLGLLAPCAGRTLDVACGQGDVLRTLADRGQRRLFGVDLAPADTGPASAARADGRRLPFADDSFERVLCLHSLHHFLSFDNVAELLRETRRVLAPGGQLYLLDHFGSLHLRLLFRLMAQPCPLYPRSVRTFGAQLREERDYIRWWLRHWRQLFPALRDAGLEVTLFRRRLFFFYLVCRPADA